MGSSMEEDQVHQETVTLPLPQLQQQQQLSCNLGGFPVSTYPVKLAPAVLPVTGNNSMENLTLGPIKQQRTSPKLIRPIPIIPVPPSSRMADLNLNQKGTHVDPLPLSLKLSTPSSSSDEQSPAAQHSSAFQAMSSGDSNSIISVA